MPSVYAPRSLATFSIKEFQYFIHETPLEGYLPYLAILR